MVDQAGRPPRNPRWLLPVTTLVATLASVGILIAVLDAPSGPQPPVPGNWQAIGTTASTIGYEGDAVGVQLDRAWTIVRACAPSGGCWFVLTRRVGGEPPLSARLIPLHDVWYATFPLVTLTCGSSAGQTSYWQQRSSWVLRFSDAGRTAEAIERSVSYAPACGYGTDTVDWTATHL